MKDLWSLLGEDAQSAAHCNCVLFLQVPQGMFLNTLLIVGGSAAAIMAYALLVVMQVHPWWQPQYLIPILGMVLGNTISGISVGLTTIIEELSSGADRVEKLLALGATRWEATRAPVARAVKLAMTPLLNQMSVVGLVSIPGMMTGQILAGSDPAQAARYQMVIMFLLGASATLGAVASIYAAVLHLVDGCHRLRTDRLIAKDKTSFFVGVKRLLVAAWSWFMRSFCCCLKRSADACTGTDAYEPLLGGADAASAPANGTGSSGGGAAAAGLLQDGAQTGAAAGGQGQRQGAGCGGEARREGTADVEAQTPAAR